MKHIVKPKKTKKQRAVIILAATLLVLLSVCIPVMIVMLSDNGGGTTNIDQPEILEGEARQNGSTLAYPVVNSINQINHISIKNETGEYGFAKLDGENVFTMYYVDGQGNRQVYYPTICSEDDSFSYSDLYAIETGDGFSQYTMLDYLCISLQMPYFVERIAVSENEAEKARQFEEYGFNEEKPRIVYFTYVDELGNSQKHTVKIGAKNISGSGYYFMVDDRQYVYASSNNYYDYAVSGYTSFLNALLVSPGLQADKGYAPYLTTAYYQWKNQVFEQEGESVRADSSVVIYADRIYSNISSDAGFIGYGSTGYGLIELDLEKLKIADGYSALVKALVGAKNGSQSQEIVVSVPSKSNYITFDENSSSKKYSYTITAIEAILTDTVDITAQGAIAGENYNLIKVTYTSSVDGKATSAHPRHAVIDLSSPALSADAISKLRATPIGSLSEADYISFDVDYSEQNAFSKSARYIITDIVYIYDKNGKETNKIKADSIVTYRYSIEVDGVVVENDSYTLDLAGVTDGADLNIKNALLGKSVSKNLNLSFDSYVTAYYESFMELTTYKISRIDYFVVKELIAAFRFQNSSQRDPYYGESLYENLLENKYKLYGLNSSACEAVVKMLGGLSDESSTATANGLTGIEVIEAGLTPEVLKKYGLYENIIYFELPRNIKAYSSESDGTNSSEEELDDYTYLSVLGFTLYISDVDPVTNLRYVASDLFDIVATIPAENFDFVNYDFESFFARRNMILMDIHDIESLNMELMMSDLKGSFMFDLVHEKVKYETSSMGNTAEYDKITVFVTPDGECTSNKLIEYMASKGYKEGVSLTELYEGYYPNDPELKDVYPDSLGTSYFKLAIRMIYSTAYVDVMPEAEREAVMNSENMVMRMTLGIKGAKGPSWYVYEFYRADDRRILVSIYQINANGERITDSVSAFYISTFAYKKIVTNFVGILNAEKIDPDVGYSDEKR